MGRWTGQVSSSEPSQHTAPLLHSKMRAGTHLMSYSDLAEGDAHVVIPSGHHTNLLIQIPVLSLSHHLAGTEDTEGILLRSDLVLVCNSAYLIPCGWKFCV